MSRKRKNDCTGCNKKGFGCNKAKETLKVAVKNWLQTKAELEETQKAAKEEIARYSKMIAATDNRFLQALDIISSLEEENSKLKRLLFN